MCKQEVAFDHCVCACACVRAHGRARTSAIVGHVHMHVPRLRKSRCDVLTVPALRESVKACQHQKGETDTGTGKMSKTTTKELPSTLCSTPLATAPRRLARVLASHPWLWKMLH